MFGIGSIKRYSAPIFKIYRRAKFSRKISRIESNDFLFSNVNELNCLMDHRAYLHDLEIPILQKYAKKAKISIVEIGCAYGASSSLFLSSINNGTKLYSIDPFVVDSMGTLHATKEKCETNVKKVLTATNKLGNLKNWEIIKDFSFNAVIKWNKPIDLLFIDGDHNYKAVKQDFDQWFPFLLKGGHIIFHDSRKEIGTPPDTFNRGWAGPTKFAEELKNDNRVEMVEEAFSMTVWKKK